MASTNRRLLDEKIRTQYLEKIKEFLENENEDVLRVKSNEIAFPVVDSEGTEKYLVITFKVPVKENYNAYEEEQNYKFELSEKKKKEGNKNAKNNKNKNNE